MSAAKHTPGPWKWDGASRIDAVAFLKPSRYVYDNGVEQVFMQGMVALPYSCGPGVTHEANALVMAAAPELLEAAEAAWNCIAELSPTQARVGVAQMLQAAIAKATGAAP